MGNAWRTLDTTAQYGWQPDLNTKTAVDLKTLMCERVEVTLEREAEEVDLLKGSMNAAPDRYFGGKSGSVVLRGPLHTFASTYDPTTYTSAEAVLAALASENFLLAQALGCGPSTAVTGTAQAGAATEITLAAGASASDDFYNGWLVTITGGTGSGQINKISDYDGASKVADVENTWTTTPDNTSTYSLVQYPHAPAAGHVYDSGDVTIGSDANTIVTTGGAYQSGEFIVAATSGTDTDPSMGWVKTGQAAGGSVELRENMANTPASGDNTYPTVTLYAGSTEQNPATLLLKGPTAADRSLRLIGAVVESASFQVETRTQGRFELTMQFSGWEWDNGVSGLEAPTSVHTVPNFIGRNNGRILLGPSGSAAVRCGLSSLAFSVTNELAYRLCPSAEEGRDKAVTTRRTIGLAFTADFDSADGVYDAAGSSVSNGPGSDGWENMIQQAATSTFLWENGPNVGRLMSLYMPAAKMAAQPGFVDTEGKWSSTVTMEADTDTGDSTVSNTSDATNSVFRIGIG